MRALILLPLALLMAGPAPAQNTPSRAQLQKLEAEQAAREQRLAKLTKDARGARREIERLRGQLINAAAERTKLEDTAADSAIRLRQLRAQERAMATRLVSQRKALEDILAALIAFERQRPPALAVNPRDAREAARAATLMAEVAPSLEARARRIAADIAALKATRAGVLAEDTAYQRAVSALERQRLLIDGLIADRLVLERSLLDDAASERARIAAIAARAASLRDLIERLTGESQKGPTLPPSPNFPQRFTQAKGQLLWPSQGTIVEHFGGRSGETARSDGITVRTTVGTQVIAPFDGRVEFAGPFRSFGRLVIINVGGGYHIVLAGLGSVSALPGQEVLAGEPIGDTGAAGDGSASLYIEVRRDGQPQNPVPWFTAAAVRQ